MRLIDADALAKAFREASETDDSKDSRTWWSEALISAAEEVDDAPTVDPTLYGYPIEHLEMIARVMEKENCTPEVVAQMLQNAGEIAKMVRDEMMRLLEDSVKGSLLERRSEC